MTDLSGTSSGSAEASTTPLPRLRVEKNRIVDDTGSAVVLRGVSMINIGEQRRDGGLLWLVDRITDIEDDEGGVPGWHPTVVRLPVYPPLVAMDGEPSTNPFPINGGDREKEAYVETLLRPAVAYAAAKRLYVIIDYHQISNITEPVAEAADAFWRFIAPRFSDYPNVLFEVFNEPIYVDDSAAWSAYRPFAQRFVETIREAAPDTLCLVGGPVWAQQIGDAADEPIDGTNIVYVSHIYPEHWSLDVTEQAERCAARHPVFVTEWGYDNDSPGGRFAEVSGYRDGMTRLLDDNALSWTAWVLSAHWYPRLLAERAPGFALTDFGVFAKRKLYEAKRRAV